MAWQGALLEGVEPHHYGLIPRISFGLFESIGTARKVRKSASIFMCMGCLSGLTVLALLQASREWSYRVEVSYLEIYNETVFDLFALGGGGAGGKGKSAPKGKMRVREHPTLGVYVEVATTNLSLSQLKARL